ncbi:MAG: cellulase family glycosylhydrolase [Dermatophilaceae bacterium]
MDRGVNLGNWLVLEKWMSPSMFAGTTAEDEITLNLQLDRGDLDARYRVHRDQFISPRDFAYLAGRGLRLVRLPVPYWVFGDTADAPGCIEYVDKALEWGERYGVRVLLDLHTVPDSQNGFDNGGLQGVCTWHLQEDKVDFALGVLERLAQRYGRSPALWGIEAVNEPISPALWQVLDVPTRYPAHDPVRAEGSEAVPTEFLKEYYRRAHERIRAHVDPGVRVVCHDGFRPAEWGDFFSDPGFENIVVDTHRYLMMHTLSAGDDTLEGYVRHLREEFGAEIARMAGDYPVLVGEWCLDTHSRRATQLDQEQQREFFRTLYDASEEAWAPAVAWTYWSYKVPIDEAEYDTWDITRAMERGWLPERFTDGVA